LDRAARRAPTFIRCATVLSGRVGRSLAQLASVNALRLAKPRNEAALAEAERKLRESDARHGYDSGRAAVRRERANMRPGSHGDVSQQDTAFLDRKAREYAARAR
jgi:hypothetical protein